MSRDIILHLLGWRLVDIENSLKDISNQGFTSIQISPIQPTKDSGFEWWKLYQPLDFSIGNSQIGTKEDLKRLCKKADMFNIKIYVDVVLRHTAGKDSGELAPHNKVNPTILNDKNCWGTFRNISDYNNRWETINLCVGVPILNYNYSFLQKIYIDFLEDLVNCGVKGFRIDMGKHFSLASEGGSFWNNVILPFERRGIYVYSECVDLDNKYLYQYMECTNVITNNNSVLNPNKEVRYVESHDTYLTFGYTKSMNDNDLVNGWRNLSANGSYSVMFYSRPWSNLWKDSRIKEINITYKNNNCNKCA